MSTYEQGREALKEKLQQLRFLLDDIEDNSGNVSGALGLLAKGLEVHDYLQSMHLADAFRMYARLDGKRRDEFHATLRREEAEAR